MNETLNIWQQIRNKSGINDEGTESLQAILTVLGYTTLESIAHLTRKNEIIKLELEFEKCRSNRDFISNYPDFRKFVFGPGTIDVLAQIAKTANKCIRLNSQISDVIVLQKEIHDKCSEVASNLKLEDITIDADEKQCEVKCPYENCDRKITLGIILSKNVNFNTFNFERHYRNQHILKERGIENILRKNTNDYNDDDEFKRLCEEKDIRIAELEKMILDLQRYIASLKEEHKLEIDNVLVDQNMFREEKSQEIEKLNSKIKMINENIASSSQSTNFTANDEYQTQKLNEENENLRALLVEKDTQSNINVKKLEQRIDLLQKKLFAQQKVVSVNLYTFKPISNNETTSIDDDHISVVLLDGTTKTYYFENIFNGVDVDYNIFIPFFSSFLSGKNTSILCYGVSGTGKSTTFFGDIHSNVVSGRGLLRTCAAYILDNRDSFCVSSIEMYGDKLYDLLNPDSSKNELKLTENAVFISQKEIIRSLDHLTQILEKIIKIRKTKDTNQNKNSSRSHLFFVFHGYSNDINKRSTLIFADLAGNEHSEGKENVAETNSINTSLNEFSLLLEQLEIQKTPIIRTSIGIILKPVLLQGKTSILYHVLPDRLKNCLSHVEKIVNMKKLNKRKPLCNLTDIRNVKNICNK